MVGPSSPYDMSGEPLPEIVVRAIMLLRANVLALGHSGVRVEVVE